MSGEKVFRDSVHGYISIPEEWCRRLVDTPIFQRLRHIEQTSMRCLYPSARHDRFVHSLGVYHLGQKDFEHLCRNARDLIKELELSPGELDRLRASFLAACLLHDCAHAPFRASAWTTRSPKPWRATRPLMETCLLSRQLPTKRLAPSSFFRNSSRTSSSWAEIRIWPPA